MSRVLHCSSVISRSSKSLQKVFRLSCNDHIFRSDLSLPSSNPLSSSHRSYSKYLIPSSSFHSSTSLTSSDSSQSQQQSQNECEEESSSDRGAPSKSQGQDQDEKQETIIERLRRLSMTPADEYRLSPMAEDKARELARARAEVLERGEQWKWDQTNLRPGGPPPQRRGHREPPMFRNWDEDADEEYGMRGGGAGGGRHQNYGSRSRPQRDYYDNDNYNDHYGDYGGGGRGGWDRGYGRQQPQRYYRSIREEEDFGDGGPQDYEVEMQKLRDKMEKLRAVKKEKEEAVRAAKKVESGNSEGSSGTSLAAYAHYIQSDPVNSGKSDDKTLASPKIVERSEEELSLEFAAYDPDTFGNLMVGNTAVLVKDSVSLHVQKELQEEEKEIRKEEEEGEEEDDAKFLPPVGERWNSRRLIRHVRELLKEKKLKEAVELFLGVLKQGGFDFDHNEIRHHFNVLIHECAEVGYVEMAWLLAKSARQRGYKDKMKTYCSLLNAVANSPWDKELNMERIEKILAKMKENGDSHNLVTYHALIKAYGRLGETLLAFSAVDEMIQVGQIRPNTETFNMLLQACISDKSNGFRHALITWLKMHSMKGIKPDIYSFNLLLRAVRDCGIKFDLGDNKEIGSGSGDQKRLDDGYYDASSTLPVLPIIVSNRDSMNLIKYLVQESPSEEETRLVVQGIGEVTIKDKKALARALSTPENRLSVLGGIRGVLTQMVHYKVPPNLKTVTQLLECSKPTELIDVKQILKTYKIKADKDFYNVAIARCYQKNQDLLAKDFLKMMFTDGHSTNIMTFGALSLGCRTWKEAENLLKEMESAKYYPNIIIMASFLKSATRNHDPIYVLKVMEETRKREIPLHPTFLTKLQQYKEYTQKALVSREMGKPYDLKLKDAIERDPDLPDKFALFKMRFKTWVNQVDVKVEPENPWKEEYQHFKEHKKHRKLNTEDNVDDLLAEKEKSAAEATNAN